ncbi:MAG: type I-C CRISPR-associated protein Cas8c/Csd1 [Rhodocyclaceae bacterium]|nr:MAG: type I-C CRISPR-associated protein Cas8c/Csd1 [Rhodocyclaceae bacterium]
MGWLQRLVETYDACVGREQFAKEPLPPISHTPQQAHIEIVLDAKGNFRRAQIVQKEETLIPATEESAGRVGTKPPPHPLCDKIQYVAGDYSAMGGTKPSFHAEYLELLAAWCDSSHAHPKAQAVLEYVRRGTVVADLVKEKLLHLSGDEKLLTRWESEGAAPDIFRLLTAQKNQGGQMRRDQGNAFVRWCVEIPGDPVPAVWRDSELQSAWVLFNASRMGNSGLCMATGETDAVLAASHPKRLRHPGDGAKLISSNDASGYTFRGRFTDDSGDQACGVGYVASQKAHLALRWLIGRQAFRNGDQVVVSWCVDGERIPDPLADTFALFGLESETADTGYQGDAGQAYALALQNKIAGYRATLPASSNVVVMGIDAATPGRMAITFYREFGGAEFLDRVEAWHVSFAWHQNFGKQRKFVGVPAPRDIAEAAYGQKVDERLRKATVERLLPCIIDGRPLPRDLVESTFRRAIRRAGRDNWEWEKTLGIACALFCGYQHHLTQGSYAMTLELNRCTRDYLFGRLLSIAEHLEQRALYYGGEKRDTHAAKLMQRFADRPCATWRQIELALTPSKSRLRSRSPGYLHKLEQQIDQIVGQFQTGDFADNRKLTCEFLLGYHCQRAHLNEKPTTPIETDEQSATEETV